MLTKIAKVFSQPRPRYAGLTHSESDRAKDFLGSMLLVSTMAKNAGIQIDMTKCIAAYRGHVGRKTACQK